MSLLCGVGECLGRQFIAKITARTAVVHRTQVDHGIHEKVAEGFYSSFDSYVLLNLFLTIYFSASTQNGLAVNVPFGSYVFLIFCIFLYVSGS